MDKFHQNILKILRKNIVVDIDVHNGIIKPLQSEYILTEQHITEIETGTTKQQKAEILLDILPSRGPYAFDIFRQALRHHYEWLSQDMDKLEENRKSFNDIKYMGTPTLPPISPLTVVREQKTKQLQYYLEQLQPNGYVVLHGMKGFGKSCLTASTLKDTKFVRNLFYNEVYWIKFGYKRSADEEILIQLNRLYHLVKNLEILPESLKPELLKDSLIHFLKYHFSRENHCQALLILDDVCDSKIIEVFDFECKTLVITADLDLVLDKRPSVISVNYFFYIYIYMTETLGLFAKVLDTEVEKLPMEAKRIHEECKGMPLLIAMFSAQFEEFKEDMKLRSDRWKYYLNSLRNRDENNQVIRKFLEKQEAIFNMCIEQLPVNMRKRYEELVIFREDVNITPQTLQILWEGCPFQVEEMMLDLCHKSLAAKQWNDELRSYIYGVHDLLLCHLRKKFSKNELIKMHQSLIEKYRKYCNDDFSKLPADNYIYSYIGYHLQQAHLYEEFPKIYLDFDFIQATVVNSGLNNLLFDLNNYRKYITKNNDPIYEVRFTDLEKFLEEQASIIVEHRRKKCLDIVQIAMNYSYDGYVKETAIKLARERSKHLYIFHNKKLGQMYVPCSEETSTEIYTTCFAYDRDLILIGNGSGEIFLWDSVYKGQKIFSGHDKNSKIKKIVISNEEDCFLSLDDHGIVKLFRLSDHENDEHNIAVLSPRQKQSSWSGIFTSTIPPDDSLITFSIADETILDMTFTHDNNHVAACTNRGTIRIWDHCGNILEDHSHNPQSYLKNIAFTMESNLLHIMDETNGVLISYCKYDKEYQYLSQYNPDLQKKNIIFFRSVPNQNNSLFIVTEEKAVYIKWFRSSNNHMHSYNKQIRANVEDKKSVYVCASLTNDGQYIVLADSSGFINIWKVDVGQQPIATYKSRVCSLDTFWLKKEGYHVICGSENQLLHKWKLPVQGTYTSIRKPVFDALVQGFGGAPDTVVTETLSNTIIALRGDKVIAESKPIDGKISHLILSDEREIIYVTDKGIVNFCDIALKNNKCILTFQSNVELVKILNILDTSVHKVIICRATDNNLQVWVNINRTYSIEDTGYVISIYEIDTKYILTVTRDGIIRIWYASGSNWLRRRKVTVGSPDIVTIFSCLSYEKRFLTVLNENGDVILYYLQYDTRTVPVSINITEHFRKKYSCKLTCCEISQNEKYLAVGFESGEISVIDISMQEEIRKLCFHTSSITQLHWAPSTVEIPILLSVSSGELVWWNITLAIYLSKPKRIRHIMNRSFSTPSVDGKVYVNSHISASQSVDSHMCDMQHQLEDNTLTNDVPNLSKFWRSKESKDPRHSALLAVVELPSNYFTKVCISADFTKFVTVDIYGSISTFTLCEYN
ncbi:PREDICTED: LOW QUALITY PROTEIN: apoptotic protease-activating factor 1 [Habropoda laboriosa]|uniref:LOW QUALITY PROTEIN: apoptotic protease-activating factor 1 n=1 Tax=Habropoda laboriosa TaxID=597456 RepID=UPI00083DA705|nr:PREDICTED: LOW QUALITY PROTEIN: apoptotic protease-activating factor 1 [Habropoda laboriosa]